jgi:type 1 fimbriae regulatory protein FimB/type 1 fimbriae regulatory protein FimE
MAKILEFPVDRRAAPTAELLKVGQRRAGRPSNSALGRHRDHLTPAEVDALLRAAWSLGRHPRRDRILILMAYRHGLRVSELINLQWDAVDLKAARLHVARLKRGIPATHPLPGDELRALRALRREYPDSPFLFVTERGGPLTRSGVNKLLARAGRAAGIPFPVTPHQLRHACGFYLANKQVPTRTIQEYLGHRNIANTQRYTALSAAAFRGLWD